VFDGNIAQTRCQRPTMRLEGAVFGELFWRAWVWGVVGPRA
jgi:hypothetical protein